MQVHAKEVKAKAGRAAGGSAKAGGFTDANAKWLTPKAAPTKPVRGKGKINVAPAPSSSPSGSDSDDKPLPGELSDGDDSLLDESVSDVDLDALGDMQGLSGSSDDNADVMDSADGTPPLELTAGLYTFLHISAQVL